MSKSAFFQI